MAGYDDPNDKGNSPTYHTGKKCITIECTNPAGTGWSPFWCFECNVKRIRGIDNSLNQISEYRPRMGKAQPIRPGSGRRKPAEVG